MIWRRDCRTTSRRSPEKTNLVVEQLLLDNLAVLPSGDGAELELERLARRLHHPPSGAFHGPIILPFQFATVQVQSPDANITL